jgi:hypothetical protein
LKNADSAISTTMATMMAMTAIGMEVFGVYRCSERLAVAVAL